MRKHTRHAPRGARSMPGWNCILALLAAMFLLVDVLAAGQCIADRLHHSCTGENCPVCHEMEAAEAFLQMVRFVPMAAALLAAASAVLPALPHYAEEIFRAETLISLKVELLD